MQLDKTHVKIRVRTLSEIGDLSLMMIRRYPRAFFQVFFWGAAFWIVADLILLGWMTVDFSNVDLTSDEVDGQFYRYLFWMATLVFLQTPIAGVLSTYSLGQSIFEHQPSLRQAIGEVRSVMGPLVWTLGFKRMAIPAMLVLAVRWGQDFSVFFDAVLPFAMLVVAALVRGNRPFIAEMIVLERCPSRSKNSAVITLKRRSKALHSPLASELGGRFLSVSLVMLAMLGCVFYSLFWIRGIAISVWTMDTTGALVFYPAALWMVASLSVVVRLLGYLDARIRLEGWEVELAIRAEAIRQFGEDIMAAPQTDSLQAGNPAKSIPSTTSPPAVSRGTAGGVAAAGGIAATGAKVMILCVSIAVGGSTAIADSPAPVVADSVWFDSDSNSLVPIEVKDDRTDSLNRESRWTPQPKKTSSKAAPPPTPPGTSSWGSWTWGNVLGWLLLAMMMALLIGLLLYVFANSSFDFRSAPVATQTLQHKSLDEQTKQRIAELPAELRDTNVNPRSEIERLMREGDFERAIIFLYGHQLLLLDRAGSLRLSRWKTNSQYVRETRTSDPSAGESLSRTAFAFERSYFGRHALTGIQFEKLWLDNLQLESSIASRVETR